MLVVSIYGQVASHEFVNYDDGTYITANRDIQEGFSAKSLAWAFTSTYTGNWHPVTWLTHVFDYGVYGENPRGHHLTNVVIHAVNSLLLFWILLQATGATWRSAFVAALFAVHPLHVESVAWAAERKDVLSAFFWMLTMLGYLRYIKAPSTGRYALVALFLSLGLMSKPMLVTLPLVLLVMDYWPLKRIGMGQGSNPSIRPVIIEKLPLFALIIVSSLVTFYAQKVSGAVADLEMVYPSMRVANAAISAVSYIWKTLWPTGLAVIYPHPGNAVPVLPALLSVLFLVTVTVFVIRSGKRHLIVGWAWFLVTLLPVIGLVQVGRQAMADRYTYIPHIGLFILISWGGAELFRDHRLGSRSGKTIGAAGALCAILALSFAAWNQTGYWKNSYTLFEQALRVTKNNYVAHDGFGDALLERGRYAEAITHYNEALRINPDYADRVLVNYVEANSKLAGSLMKSGKYAEAALLYADILNVRPNDIGALNNKAIAMAQQDRFEEAVPLLLKSIEVKPNDIGARLNLCLIFEQLGRIGEAHAHVTKILEMSPDNSDARELMRRLSTKGKP
ncbi:MAG: tetratricopeptide repeat protein [Nitrospirae bacterium]|nr:tetratricopeptide repeat protein [Nitrospirota bacterium]